MALFRKSKEKTPQPTGAIGKLEKKAADHEATAAKLHEKAAKKKEDIAAAAAKFAELASDPAKAYAKTQRDRWLRRYAVAATTTAALSLTAQFTDLDEKAMQSISDKYDAVISVFSGSEQSSTENPQLSPTDKATLEALAYEG